MDILTSPRSLLNDLVAQALRELEADGLSLAGVEPEALEVVRATDPRWGDFQFNGALPLARANKKPPREVAARLLEALEPRLAEIAPDAQIAGPGFLNLRLSPDFLNRAINQAATDSRAGYAPGAAQRQKRRVVVDFSSPNVAKPMHVGHIRSTLIGDAIARLLRWSGHEVITDNHIGDWGTAFGKIIVGWKSEMDEAALERDPIAEMERLYRAVNARPELEDAARAQTAALQAGDATNLAIWQRVRVLSQSAFDAIYERLGVRFDHTLGESFYNPRLPSLVDELLERGIARESQGAVAIFSNGELDPKHDPFLISRDGEWVDFPAIVRKSDGAATYATTDLATLEYRIREWRPDEILYVTDSRQSGHFRQVFAAFERWQGTNTARLHHVGFGMILGEDRTPFKTRSGATVRLEELLDEAQERALAIVRAKNPDAPDQEVEATARVLGIAAIKYADLSQNRATDSVFSWDKMLSLSGNSAPYLLYAFVRCASLLRRAQTSFEEARRAPLELSHPAEFELARHLLRWSEAIDGALADYRPHLLGDYLFALAGALAAFWRDCRVLEAPERASRLALVALTGTVLRTGLDLLGIETLDQM